MRSEEAVSSVPFSSRLAELEMELEAMGQKYKRNDEKLPDSGQRQLEFHGSSAVQVTPREDDIDRIKRQASLKVKEALSQTLPSHAASPPLLLHSPTAATPDTLPYTSPPALPPSPHITSGVHVQRMPWDEGRRGAGAGAVWVGIWTGAGVGWVGIWSILWSKVSSSAAERRR